jgi:Flp pilus assembly protein TadG
MTHNGTAPRRGRRLRHRPVRRTDAMTATGMLPVLSTKRGRGRGQTLVEFALVFPLFILLMMTVIEFSFAFNASLSIAFASRDAALIAAEAGDSKNSDCVIITSVLNDVGPPADRAQISSIEIYWSDQNGGYKNGDSSLAQIYVADPGNPTTCSYPVGPDIVVPFRQTANGYADSTRCNIVAGCGGAHTPSVDTIGVRVNYTYTWKTPMRSLIGLASNGPMWSYNGWNFARSNAMRMEPVL